MSLRARLTLFYTLLLSGLLLFFGGLVYWLIGATLLANIDASLQETARQVIRVLSITPGGEIQINLLPGASFANTYIQVWDRNGRLLKAIPDLPLLRQPLDSAGLRVPATVVREVQTIGDHLRVLTVPVFAGTRRVATLQIATSLQVLDSTRRDLIFYIVSLLIFSFAVAAWASWLAIGRALAPLSTMLETANQINRASDLSRRIPVERASDDEIGRLIQAFNQTLERLEQLFTTQQRFLADVSHELRTPLTVIKGNMDLMRRMKQIDPESFESIDAEVNRLTRLVNSLLLLAQAESGYLRLNFENVELDTLLVEVYQELRLLAQNKKIQMELSEMDQVQVRGDRDRLKQVLLNLVSNAIQYTPSGGKVTLSLQRVGQQARLVVRDTGPGIPPEDLPHIFDRFYRAEKSRTRSGQSSGFGLGLSIAKWIVDHHQGHIQVDSRLGEGTAFIVWLPLPEEGKTEGENPGDQR
ncbi:MAG: ATP-binding protein [Anaerolineales bacterium]